MANPSPQQQLDGFNARILDVSFLLNGQEHALNRILQFRATLNNLPGTEQVFATLTALRTDVERQINLLRVLLDDLMARRLTVYRIVESQTRPGPALFPAVGDQFSGAADLIEKGTDADIVWKNIPDNNPADLAGGQLDLDDYKGDVPF